MGFLIVIKNRDSLSGIYKSSELHDVNTGEVIDGLASSVEYRFKEPVPVVEMALDKDVAKRTFEVSGHIRNLSMGHRASQTKIDIAKAQGIELLEGQTLVATYTKGLSAA